MKIHFKYVMLAIAILGSASVARAEIIDQIGGTFTAFQISTTTPSPPPVLPPYPNYSAQSMTDTGIIFAAGAFAEAYDNFTFTTDTTISQLDWIGRYDANSTVAGAYGDTLADPGTFQIGFNLNFYNDSGANTPGSLIGTVPVATSLAPAGQTAISPSGLPLFYSYSAAITGINVTAGQQFWVSVVAQMDYNDNGWGLAASDVGGTLSSSQTFQGNPHNGDAWNYAMKVTAVPEPTSGLALLSLVGLMGFRRRRR